MKLIKKENSLIEFLSKLAKNNFDVLEEGVYQDYKEFLETKEYPYLDSVVEYIIKKYGLGLTVEEKDNLHTQIYNCAQWHRKEERLKFEAKMISDGFINPFTLSLEEKENLNGKKIQYVTQITTDWLARKLDKVGKFVFIKEKGTFGILPKGCRTRGFSQFQFDYLFIKTI